MEPESKSPKRASDERNTSPSEDLPKEVTTTARDDAQRGYEDDNGHTPGRDEDDEEGEEEDHEPKLKYTRLTGNLSSVYRSGDSTSAFLASGDKLVVGTHNGGVQVIGLPAFEVLRQYPAPHSASVTAISVSPYAPHIAQKTKAKLSRSNKSSTSTPTRPPPAQSSASPLPRSPKQPAEVSATPDHSLHVATASVDGNICIFSLADLKDVTQRNYGRPMHAVALSPEFKSDRSFLCGGTAGDLILTSGAPTGTRSDANVNSNASGASAWLGSLGLGSGTGKDTVLHSGEGGISMIAWSLSGRYVTWVNEQGVKIMRSNLHLTTSESESAWKRLAHLDLDRPNRRSWEDMAGAWKARAQWVDDQYLETSIEIDDEAGPMRLNETIAASLAKSGTDAASIRTSKTGTTSLKSTRSRAERLIVGWGDTVWVINVTSTFTRPEVIKKLLFDDCIVSGLALYTPSTLLLLAFRTRDDEGELLQQKTDDRPRKGARRRGNNLPPDLRIIDLDSTEEDTTIEVEGLEMKDFHSLSSGDYHMSTVFIPRSTSSTSQPRSTLGSITSGLVDAGAGATRFFSSGASVLSGSSGERTLVSSYPKQAAVDPGSQEQSTTDQASSLSKPGLKIFIQSPFDFLVAVKTEKADKLKWLLETQQYDPAWNLIDQHPDLISSSKVVESMPGSPIATPRQTLTEFFTDDSSSHVGTTNQNHGMPDGAWHEKLRIGELWLEQLINSEEWDAAGETAQKVLSTSPNWERWIYRFIEGKHIDSVSPYIPSKPTKPRISPEPYELVLSHYVTTDRLRLQDLLNEWDSSLFEKSRLISQIEKELKAGRVTETSTEGDEKGRDWRLLLGCLAKLYIADERPSDALKCYLRTKSADDALGLVSEFNILQDVEDIFAFISLRASREQLSVPDVATLDKLTVEPIGMLVAAAISGLVSVESVVHQLRSYAPAEPLLFLYLRALWLGKTSQEDSEPIIRDNQRGRQRYGRNDDSNAARSRRLLDAHGDMCVSLFAKYSRDLLKDLLKTTDIYNFDHAIAECQRLGYTTELVHLLTRTGRPHDALHLIIDELGDVAQAIAFAQDQDDRGIWDDLLEYSMDRPKFIVGLLEHGGGLGAGSIDAADLVKRIPGNLEIEGLKPALQKLLKQAEVQCAISTGAAKVFRGEVGSALDALTRGRSQGLPVNGFAGSSPPQQEDRSTVLSNEDSAVRMKIHNEDTTSGEGVVVAGGSPFSATLQCSICSKAVAQQQAPTVARPSSSGSDSEPRAPENEDDGIMLATPCGHVHHLSCILDSITSPGPELRRRIRHLLQSLSEQQSDQQGQVYAGVGRPRARVSEKVARAQMIADVLGDHVVCALCDRQVNSAMA